MAQPLVIVGAGGHGREVLDVVEAVNSRESAFRFLGFLDDDPDRQLLCRRGAPWLGPLDRLAEIDAGYVIGIGAGRTRRRVDLSASASGRPPIRLVHPETSMGSQVALGPGVVVAAGARLTTNVRVGRHTHLNVNTSISHDCVVGDYVTLAPGAHVSGCVTLGDGVWVGTGASIIQGVTIGADAVIGAGAAVVTDIAAGVTAVGVPARPLRR